MYSPAAYFVLMSILEEANYKINYGITPIICINWEREPTGYAENPDNWIKKNRLRWQF
jgi:hypothetical protein